MAPADVHLLDPRQPESRAPIKRAWSELRDPNAVNLFSRDIDFLWRNLDFMSPPALGLRFLVVTIDGAPRALFAIETDQVRLGPIRARALRFLNPTVLPAGGALLIRPGDQEAWSAFGAYMRSGRLRWRVFALDGLEVGSEKARQALQMLAPDSLAIERPPLPQYFADLPEDPQDYLSGLRGKLRQNIRRGRDKLAGLGAVAYGDGGGDAAVAFASVEKVDRASWRVADQDDAATNEKLQMLCRSLMEVDRDTSHHLVRLLSLDGVPIAGHYSYRVGQTLLAIKNVFDEAYSAGSPGMVVFVDVILEACRSGVRRIEFHARNEYVRRLSTGTRWLTRDLLFNRRNTGLALGLASRAFLALRSRYQGPAKAVTEGEAEPPRGQTASSAATGRPHAEAVAASAQVTSKPDAPKARRRPVPQRGSSR